MQFRYLCFDCSLLSHVCLSCCLSERVSRERFHYWCLYFDCWAASVYSVFLAGGSSGDVIFFLFVFWLLSCICLRLSRGLIERWRLSRAMSICLRSDSTAACCSPFLHWGLGSPRNGCGGKLQHCEKPGEEDIAPRRTPRCI